MLHAHQGEKALGEHSSAHIRCTWKNSLENLRYPWKLSSKRKFTDLLLFLGR